MKVYFPDTNFFFECRKAADLLWHELDASASGDTTVRLIVPSAVVTEIERHKNKGNDRLSKRAREASAVLRRALQSPPDHRTEIRPADPQVILELPPVVKIDFAQFPALDPNRPDHRIAAEYAVILKQEPDLVVLTDDTLLVLAVRSLGFEAVLIPQGWKLGPEKDDRDDEIDKLHNEVKSLKQTLPEVSLKVLDLSLKEIDTIKAEIQNFAPSKQEIESAIAAVQAKFPEETDFRRSPPSQTPAMDGLAGLFEGRLWRAPTEEDITKYKTTAYPNWLKSVRDHLNRLPVKLNNIAYEIPFLIQIVNSGFVNATSVRLTITGYDGITLLDAEDMDKRKERKELILLPQAPEAPRGHYVSLSLAAAFRIPSAPRLLDDFMRIPTSRNPNSFYFAKWSDSPANELELECEALPHQIDPHFISLRAIIPIQGLIVGQPRVRVRLQASNLKRPIEKHIPVRADIERGDFLLRVDELMRLPRNRSEDDSDED
jgi:hypothetical protein